MPKPWNYRKYCFDNKNNLRITSPEIALTVIKSALLNATSSIFDKLFDSLYGNTARDRHYLSVWEKTYGLPKGMSTITPFGYHDPFGITKYYSWTFSPYVTLEAGEDIPPNSAVYIGEDGKVYAQRERSE